MLSSKKSGEPADTRWFKKVTLIPSLEVTVSLNHSKYLKGHLSIPKRSQTNGQVGRFLPLFTRFCISQVVSRISSINSMSSHSIGSLRTKDFSARGVFLSREGMQRHRNARCLEGIGWDMKKNRLFTLSPIIHGSGKLPTNWTETSIGDIP